MTPDSSVTELKGVGTQVAQRLAAVGVKTIADLIDYYPRRYDDYSNVLPIKSLKPGPVTIKVRIKDINGRYVRRGMHITEAVASDETGSVRLIWFNQPYRKTATKLGEDYYVSGLFELSRQRFSIINPSLELATSFPVNTARIVPIYRETKGLSSRQIRGALKNVIELIEQLPESLPNWLLKQYKLLSRAQALLAMHFPESGEQLAAARLRLGFEEVFDLNLASLLNKQANQLEAALKIDFKETLAKQFVGHLPFQLTDAQRRVVWQIYLDMQQPHPMNRLVEGDVGSGKTVVATMAALMAIEQGWQVAFMAPTELLARQHADTIFKLLEPLGLASNLTILTGSLTTAQKKAAHQAIKSGQVKFIVGTHALIQEKVDMHKLALVIFDEQHRFGVEQRKQLQSKAGHMPHVLSLTATPIPRSLALTLFGELDISILGDKPPGRQPIITKIISPAERQRLNVEIKAELEAGRQMFVVCPQISQSDDDEVKSVEKVYEQLSQHDFKGFKVGLIHGRLKSDQKNQVMDDFVAGMLDILVATTVIEVGVDVPNATIMMIESAERFGLAQAHQLRGRVGRGQHQGYCYLMLSDSSAPTKRLRALASSSDGFKLAEMDLEIRGPGAIYGQMQHGALDLRVANISDAKLIATARQAAQNFLDKDQNLLQYKELSQQVARLRAVTNLN